MGSYFLKSFFNGNKRKYRANLILLFLFTDEKTEVNIFFLDNQIMTKTSEEPGYFGPMT